MSNDKIGTVESGKGHSFDVSFDGWGNVFVKQLGGVPLLGDTWHKAGKASSPGEALRIAQAFVYNQ